MDEGSRKDVTRTECQPKVRRKGDTSVFPFSLIMLRKLLSCIIVLLLFGTAFAEEKRTEIPIGDSPSLGPVDAPVTMVEFLDFQ